MKDIIVEVEDLTMAYHDQPVLWDNDIQIVRGSRTAIIGPNGAGKSTLLKGILGLQKKLSGVVTIDGLSVQKARNKISYMPQKNAVNWDFPTTVFDVVLMGRYVHLGWIKRPKKEDKLIAEKALEKMGMLEFRNRQISQLSGGQRQRVFIARSIASNAEIYFMDEPLAGVDKITEKAIMDFIKDAQKQNKTCIVVHHDLNTIREYFDHVVMLNKVVVAQGPVEEILTQENLNRTFGGR